MALIYGKQDLEGLTKGEAVCCLLTNGLGGYASVSAAFSVSRCDQGILVSAAKAPNVRRTLVHRLRERLRVGDRWDYLSSQGFAGQEGEEDGWRQLSAFTWDHTPCWRYQTRGVQVERQLCMAWEANAAAVLYTVENLSDSPCLLEIVPQFKFASKEDALTRRDMTLTYGAGKVTAGEEVCYLTTDARVEKRPQGWELLAYPRDAQDGRPGEGLAASCCAVTKLVRPGKKQRFAVVFSDAPGSFDGWQLLERYRERKLALAEGCGLAHPMAKALAAAADAFICRRESTGGKTILAGYPLFSDWGRDTMIALPGCCLSTGRYDDARSILRTFLAYEKDGLVPNLFPEGDAPPMYNTADAALLLIDCVWQYYTRTGDLDFVKEAYPVMERIIRAYRKGTRHGIAMDGDGLIRAGQGMDQVTWMDVCVDGVLPTPRHGKPVEINAYWYSALRVMETCAKALGCSDGGCGTLAKKVKKAFAREFYREDLGCLKDVLCGEPAEDQLRCNQIWAVSISFCPLSKAQARAVTETVYRTLYTSCGLRSLWPGDPQYRGVYNGSRFQRDMAYHQGTVWVFPLGGFLLAWLKTHGNSPEAAAQVRIWLEALEPMLREGCAGQLPEIYDGDFPAQSKGCFAQAWSVGELLRVLEALEAIEGLAPAKQTNTGEDDPI